MAEINKRLTFNGLSLCFVILLYNGWYSNYIYVDYIYIVLQKVVAMNYMSFVILTHVSLVYYALSRMTIDLNIQCSVKFNKKFCEKT